MSGGAIGLEQLLPLTAHVAGALQYMANSGYVHIPPGQPNAFSLYFRENALGLAKSQSP